MTIEDLDSALCVLTALIADQLPNPEKLREALEIAGEEMVNEYPGTSVVLCRMAGMIRKT